MLANLLRRRTRALLMALAAVACCSSSFAADKELLDILLANGAITQPQYERLLAKEKLDRADVDRVVTTLDRNGLRAESADGNYRFHIGTRLHAEASVHSGDLPPGIAPVNGTELRRARIEAKGTLGSAWNWAAEVDVADNSTAVKDFWLGYQTQGGALISFGHQKQPFSLSVEMSSNDIPFIERSVDSFLLVPYADRAIGVRAETSGAQWFVAGGIYGEAVDPRLTSSDEGWGVAGRLVYAPVIGDNRIVHLGLRGLVRTPSSDANLVRIRDETTHMSTLRIVDTGVITDVSHSTITGAEAAFASGPWSVVGEYNLLSITRDALDNIDFDSWSVYLTWSLTGESRARAYRIDAGEFKRLTPAQDFNPKVGGSGAWELALRYAAIDLNDGSIVGGEESVLTSGLNWYPNANVRLMIEWSRILDTDASTALRDAAQGLNIFQFRTQYTF